MLLFQMPNGKNLFLDEVLYLDDQVVIGKHPITDEMCAFPRVIPCSMDRGLMTTGFELVPGEQGVLSESTFYLLRRKGNGKGGKGETHPPDGILTVPGRAGRALRDSLRRALEHQGRDKNVEARDEGVAAVQTRIVGASRETKKGKPATRKSKGRGGKKR